MLAEYDALPEIGHACGHNLIAMISVGSGIVIKEFVDKYGEKFTSSARRRKKLKGQRWRCHKRVRLRNTMLR